MTSHSFRPDSLDVRAFAQQGALLEGPLLLSKLERIVQDLYGAGSDLNQKIGLWKAQGESRPVQGGAAQAWLHLSLDAQLALQCQRCLQGMCMPVQIERSFRFVRDEREADAQDEASQEDLLVASKQMNLFELIEDEIIMAWPFAPTHAVCPTAVKLQSGSAQFDAALQAKPSAFAALGQLKSALEKI